jgi:F-type H+-transporting ATPase subunit epsilon
MAGNIQLEIVTPEKVVVSEEAQIVASPGTLGEFGVLIGHTPFMTTLKMGPVRYTDADGAERYVFASGGFAEALPDKVTILAESAEKRRDIDIDRANAALERAQQRLAEDRGREDIDFTRAKAALERAMQRIKLTKLSGN